MSPPRLILTGAAGFLGSAVASEYVSRGWEVHGIDAVAARPPAPDLASFEQITLRAASWPK